MSPNLAAGYCNLDLRTGAMCMSKMPTEESGLSLMIDHICIQKSWDIANRPNMPVT